MKKTDHSIYSGNSDKEFYRIARQNTIFNHFANQHLNRIFEHYPNPNVLDVGCSDGINTMLRFRGRAYHCLVGLDYDAQKIAYAKKNYADPKHTFVVSDITAPDFVDVLLRIVGERHISGFHVIHIASVLLHLPCAEKVIASLKRFLMPDGVFFIQEEDDGCNLAYPSHPFFDKAFYLWDHSLESGDRRFARKIPHILQSCGLTRITVLSMAACSTDFEDDHLEAFWDLYFNDDLWAADTPEYFDTDVSSLLEEYHQEARIVKNDFLAGKYFVVLGVYFYMAQ